MLAVEYSYNSRIQLSLIEQSILWIELPLNRKFQGHNTFLSLSITLYITPKKSKAQHLSREVGDFTPRFPSVKFVCSSCVRAAPYPGFSGFPSPSHDMHIRRTGNSASLRANACGLFLYVALPRSGDSSGVNPHMHPKTSWERLQEPVAVAINEDIALLSSENSCNIFISA